MTWAVWRDPSGSVGVTRYRDATEAAAACKTRGCVLLDVADDQATARRVAHSLTARFERVRCAHVFPSRRRCSNTATNGDRCNTHG